jgi:hypothetical protein
MQAEMKWEDDGQQWFLTPDAAYAMTAHKTQGERSSSREAAARRVAQPWRRLDQTGLAVVVQQLQRVFDLYILAACIEDGGRVVVEGHGVAGWPQKRPGGAPAHGESQARADPLCVVLRQGGDELAAAKLHRIVAAEAFGRRAAAAAGAAVYVR